MIFLKQILQKSWRIVCLANFVISIPLFFPIFWLLLQNEALLPQVMRLKRVWAKFIMHNVGVFYSMESEVIFNAQQAYVFCPNHTSYLDIALGYAVIPNYFHYMGKAELAKIPFFGYVFRKTDIAVERDSIRDAHRAFTRAGNDIAKGISITIFPEGTTSNSPPAMRRFKNGAFKLAIEKQVPIVPVTFKNNWRLLPEEPKKNSNYGGPGIARVVIHQPIETTGLTEADMEGLKERVRNVIEKSLTTS